MCPGQKPGHITICVDTRQRDRICDMTHPFIPFEDVAKLEMVFFQYGQFVENVHYFHHTAGPFTVTDMQTLAADMKTWWNTNMKGKVVSSAELEKIRVKDMSSENAPGIEYQTGLPIAGTNGVQGAPSNVTVAIKWTTGYSGRSFRGRSYFVGLAAADVVADVVNAAALTNILTAYDLLITAPPAGWVLGVASMQYHKAWRVTGLFTPIITVSAENYSDSQRRRLVGRGR